MVVKWILLGLLGLLILLLCWPVTVETVYRDEVLRVRARLLGVWLRILPHKERPPKKEKPQKEKPAKAEKPPKPKKNSQPLPLADLLGIINDLLPQVGKAVGRILRRITVSRCRGRLTIQGEDAAETGIKYGQTSALCCNIYVALAAAVRLREWRIALVPDFTEEPPPPPELELRCSASPAVLLYAVLRLAGAGLIAFSKTKDNNKRKVF